MIKIMNFIRKIYIYIIIFIILLIAFVRCTSDINMKYGLKTYNCADINIMQIDSIHYVFRLDSIKNNVIIFNSSNDSIVSLNLIK